MTAARHHGLVGVFVLAFVALTLAAPASVAGCMCSGIRTGDVIFTGTVTDVRFTFTGDLPSYGGNVIAFHIEEVTRGDPGDGRVYTSQPPGGCGRYFQLGARYLVHASAVAPVGPFRGRPPDVPLATGSCMKGEDLGLGNPVVAARALAATPAGIALLVVVAVVAATTLYVSQRRSGRRGEQAE